MLLKYLKGQSFKIKLLKLIKEMKKTNTIQSGLNLTALQELFKQ